MIEQLFFITLSITLFGLIFYKIIKKNDTEYIFILILEAIGIIIDGVCLILNHKLSIFTKILTYIVSIAIPLIVVVLEYKKIDVIQAIKLMQVKFYIKTGNNKKAKEILLNIIGKNKNNYNAHKMLAEIYEKEGGIRKAIDEYVICIDINKKDYDSYFKIALLLEELDKKEESIEILYSLLDKKQDYLPASIKLGDLLTEQARYKEAVTALTEALKYNPLSFDINYELGIVYTMLNDFKSAKEYYEKAAEINKLIYNAKYSLAQIALLYKDIDQAEKLFEEALEDDDLSADSYFELSKIKLMKGNKEQAIKYANIAMDLNARRIAKRIKKEPLFIPIMTKIAIPFNLETEEIKQMKLTAMEMLAKDHLEETSDITTNKGYISFEEEKDEKTQENQKEK